MLKVVCAWCSKHLKGSETADEVSHGICVECQSKTEAAYPLPGPDHREERALDSDSEGHFSDLNRLLEN